jgi:hypothetical protein
MWRVRDVDARCPLTIDCRDQECRTQERPRTGLRQRPWYRCPGQFLVRPAALLSVATIGPPSS